MIDDHDEDLKQRFVALRRAAEAASPSFQATVAKARAGGGGERRRRWLPVATALGVGVALALLLMRRQPLEPHVAIDPATVRWRAPTDFLLTLPGDELLRRVPRLGQPTFNWRTL
jgi:hypothetical protein